MGIWFMASALGNLIAGLLAAQIGAEHSAVSGAISPDQAVDVFAMVAWVSIGAGLILFLTGGYVKRLMHGVK
nr:MFS transporter [Gemmatimonadota bacterium]